MSVETIAHTDPVGAHADDRVRLGRTRWRVQADFVLRSAGFQAASVLRLCDEELAAAADQGLRPKEFAARYREAAHRLGGVIRELAADPLMREAVAWQNLRLLGEVFDKLAGENDMSGARRRSREITFAGYLQRYAAKNDTIGFFGPIAWGRLRPDRAGVTVRPGRRLLRSRAVFFEWWAIDTLARVMSQEPDVFPWLKPRIAEHWSVGPDGLRGPRDRTPDVTAADLELLHRCDGTRTVTALAAQSSADDVARRLRELAERGILLIDLAGPFTSRPELELREKLLEIPDEPVRARLLESLDTLTAARDLVGENAGDAAGLSAALAGLNEAFERITRADASRRHGEMYAGRTLVYEDTTRDLTVEFGPQVLDRVAEPLGMVLDSADWLVRSTAAAYRKRFCVLYDRTCARLGRADVPLDVLVGAATPDLEFQRRALAPLVAEQSALLRRKWERVLCIPADASRHSVGAAEIADRFRAEFPAGPLPWSAARHHSPDLLLAATDVEAVERGDFTVVLGEIHLAMNTLDTRFFVEHHPDPQRLHRQARAEHGDRRVVPIPSRFSHQVTSRTYPPTLLSPDYTYWSMYANTTGAPGRIIPAADLLVRRESGALVVVDRRTGARRDLLDVVGDYLSGVLLNAFGVVEPRAHRPRIAIDRLVLAREAWSFPMAKVTWPAVKDEATRFQHMWQWRHKHGLPRQVFFQADGEDKPVFLDFTSPALVNLAAATIRRAAGAGAGAEGTVTFSETLPGLDQCWLPDGQGRRYTSELRLACSDPTA